MGFLFFFIAFYNVTSGQKIADSVQLAKLLKHYEYHCDTAMHQWENFFLHEESQLRLSYLSISKFGDSLVVKGRLTNYRLEPIAAPVFLAETGVDYCHIYKQLTHSDNNGLFECHLYKAWLQSIYFIVLGFKDAELKVTTLATF